MNDCCPKCGEELALHFVNENGTMINHDFEQVCPACGEIVPGKIIIHTPNEYQRFAMRTCSIPYEDKMNMLIHATTGLASEAGEFGGLLQKVYQGHEYDRVHALKELGDCLWMIAEACTALDATLEEVMRMNIDKLRARYPEGFDPEKSLHRKEGGCMTYGSYTKLSGKEVTWEDIQRVHDKMHASAVATCHNLGMPEKVCDIKMIVKVCTEKEALLGDLVAGVAPWITIGWKVDV